MEQTNFGVIYRANYKAVPEIAHEIYVSRLRDIWGIEIDGIKISCREYSCKWVDAIKQTRGDHERMFTEAEIGELFKLKDRINQAFETLKKYGVKVDLIESKCFWTAIELSDRKALIFRIFIAGYETKGANKRDCYFVRTTLA